MQANNRVVFMMTLEKSDESADGCELLRLIL